MRLPSECYQMQKTIETHLPHLSQPQLTGLALWVCGAILAGSACQNAVASALSPWSNWYNLRQRLREWLYDGGDRATPCQTELAKRPAAVGPLLVAVGRLGLGQGRWLSPTPYLRSRMAFSISAWRRWSASSSRVSPSRSVMKP